MASYETDLSNQGEIYCITNQVTKQLYVGKTKCMKKRKGKLQYCGYQDRFRQHLSRSLSTNRQIATQCAKLYSAIRTYGIDKFTVTLIERVPLDIINQRERHYIRIWKTRKFGYNMATGGNWMPRSIRIKYRQTHKK